MSQKFSHKYNATNTQGAMDKIKDIAVSAGWALHDDQSGASPYAYILSSTGENSDQMPCYLRMYQDTNIIVFLLYGYWNNSTHVGTYYIGHTPSRVVTDDDASFDIYVSANKDCIMATAYIPTQWRYISVGLLDPFVDDAEGTLDTAASSGSNVDLSLGSGEAAGFIVGHNYQIVDGTSRQWVEVNAINTGTDTITIATLSYDFAVDARIGNFPYRWFVYNSQYQYCYLMRYNLNGTANNTTNTGVNAALMNSVYVDPNPRAGQSDLYTVWPLIIHDSACLAGITNDNYNFLRADINLTTHEHTMSVGDIDTGTSTGSNTSTTLNDTGKAWTTDVHQDKVLIITAGIGVGQFRVISSNTGTEITVPTWTTTPDGTSEYTICEEGWLYLYFSNAAAPAGIMRAY